MLLRFNKWSKHFTNHTIDAKMKINICWWCEKWCKSFIKSTNDAEKMQKFTKCTNDGKII